MISERRHAILGLIIEHYLRTGEPIGSKTLCQLLPYSISSATIRNEMAYLTQLGFLEQRHTSGGRVPSKASYRYYVDNIMQEKPISKYETDKINEALSVNSGDPERLLADACKLLEEYSHCAAFCATLEDPYDCIQGVDLIPAGNQKAMLVMLTVGSKIKSSLINMPCALDEDFRKKFYEVSAKFLTGTPLTNVNLALIQSAVGVAGERIFDMLPALSSLCALCNEASHSKLTLEGETNLLSHSELGSDLYKILGLLTEKKQLMELSKSFANSNSKQLLLIGDENPIYEMKNTSTVIAKYNYEGGQKAVLGVIGSMRIDYESILPRINYIINTVDSNFRKRSEKEKNESFAFATIKAVSEILATVDNLERAIASEQEDYEGLKKGVQMTYDGLMASLEKLGVTAYGEQGEQFDPNLHHAVMHIDDDSLDANVITDVFQKGYKYNDKVVRPAMVKTAN